MLVTRTAYDAVVSERDRLRKQVDRLLDHVTRMDRIEHGAHEIPQEKAAPREPMPDWLDVYIDESFASDATRKDIKRDCYRLHERGERWERIGEKLKASTSSDAPNAVGMPG